MTFMSNLAANPGGTGIYGASGTSQSQADQDALGIVNRIKDRDMQDFQTKANFMADLSLKQERMRKMYDPTTVKGEIAGQTPQGAPGQGQMNTVVKDDSITPFQKAQLGMEQQKTNIEQQKATEAGKIGEERLGIQSAQEKLNQQKSDQINAIKQQDLERKTNEANQKYEAAKAELDRKTKAGEDTIQAHKDLAAAVEARHALEMEKKDAQFRAMQEQHKAQIKAYEDRTKQQGNTKTTTKINPEGTERTVTTARGSSARTVQVTGKDGNTYEIPEDKLDDWNENHAGE